MDDSLSLSSHNDVEAPKSDKVKAYVRSCKEIIKKQSEQLKNQQKDFRSAVAQLETQQFTARFHAVAFKLELVLTRVFETLNLKMTNNQADVFFCLRRKMVDSKVKQKCTVVLAAWKLKASLGAVFGVLRGLRKNTLVQAFATVKNAGNSEARTLRRKLDTAERDKEELLKKLAKASGDEAALKNRQRIKDLTEENRGLKEKLVQTEQNVSVFVKEMANLLDQHQPEGLRRAEVEAAINKVRRPAKARARSRVNPISPEREGGRRGDRSHKVQFD
mmetsp:Transcript_1794/g.3886  ORF Transcript_1794/g.3886 Transcript_1794/m.3886 type:complete len:275 (-) Transcript_1794:34-858(-)